MKTFFTQLLLALALTSGLSAAGLAQTFDTYNLTGDAGEKKFSSTKAFRAYGCGTHNNNKMCFALCSPNENPSRDNLDGCFPLGSNPTGRYDYILLSNIAKGQADGTNLLLEEMRTLSRSISSMENEMRTLNTNLSSEFENRLDLVISSFDLQMDSLPLSISQNEVAVKLIAEEVINALQEKYELVPKE